MQHITDTPRPYTLQTVADVPYGTYPKYPEGPAMVLSGAGYNVSVTTSDTEPGAVSGAYKILSIDPWKVEPHPLDKVEYPDAEAARKAQYEAGLLAYMVYDDSKWADVVVGGDVTEQVRRVLREVSLWDTLELVRERGSIDRAAEWLMYRQYAHLNDADREAITAGIRSKLALVIGV